MAGTKIVTKWWWILTRLTVMITSQYIHIFDPRTAWGVGALTLAQSKIWVLALQVPFAFVAPTKSTNVDGKRYCWFEVENLSLGISSWECENIDFYPWFIEFANEKSKGKKTQIMDLCSLNPCFSRVNCILHRYVVLLKLI